MGFDEHATSLLENYLNNRTQRCVLNRIQSDGITQKKGVIQNIILGLLLFNIYAKDMSNTMEVYTIVRYADDTFLHPTLTNFG